MRARSFKTIARYGREYAIAYTDGSSTEGKGNGGYGIYFLWPDGSTTRKCGPVGEWTCSCECELIWKQREGAALPGVVILTDCRALVQALGDSGSKGVGEAVLLADYLPLVDYGPVDSFPHWGPWQQDSRRTSKQGKVNAAATGRSCNAAPPSCGVPLSYLMMNDSPVSMKLTRRVIIYKVCQGMTLYQSFVQQRGTRSSWRTKRDRLARNYCLSSLWRKGRNDFACPVRMSGSG
ncbi:hypothetical protein PoB_000846200 [Plakobranchus ocellatus]|uniref:RNase H type-1 domain-containing protein n=1 Tax=Plakobranchus ocellatus TaxID=259542 RepID=A0AAV3YHR0_9GAST|nr:hypothetical protein PoB_000846200 [Plakobranchus ocellatus]